MKKNKDELIAGLIELCGLRPWRRALFTTYSLNLSFFEAFILPKLEEVGCSDILILVDHSFYLESVSERQSSAAGRAYRIAPVKMRTGVFHPKLCYLWSDEEDACAIGSGNLTYAGQGANLECLDILLSAREPQPFASIADFFEALVSSAEAKLLDQRERLEVYARRARTKSRAPATPDAPIVLHSLREPIIPQLIRLLTPFAPFERLVCMSPFHDPKGAPLVELIAKLGVGSAHVAIDPATKSAPFDASVLRPHARNVRFVIPSETDHRCLHAKWFEFHRAGKSCVMSGSANATKPALSSVENAEVVVVRLEPSELIDWTPAKPDAVRRDVRELPSPTFDGYLVAAVSGNAQLAGKIEGPRDLQGTWACLFSARHQIWDGGIVTTQPDGTFSMRISSAIEEACAAGHAIQLRMSRNGTNVAGWVAFQAELDSPPEARGARVALDRISRGQTLAGDVIRVVNWVCSLIDGTVSAAESAEPGDRQRGQEDNRRLLSHSEWSSQHSDRAASRSDGMLGLVRRTIDVLAIGKDELIRLSRHSAEERLEENDETDQNHRVQDDEYDVIREVTDALYNAVREDPQAPLAVEFIRAHAMLTFRPAVARCDLAVASTKALEWIRWIAPLQLTSSARESLSALVWALAGLGQSQTNSQRAQARAAELRQLLERMLGRAAPPSIDGANAFSDPILACSNRSFQEESDRGVSEILTAQSLRSELASFIAAAAARSRPSIPQVLEESIDRRVLNKLRSGASAAPMSPSSNGCPHCNCAITGSERTILNTRLAIPCRACGSVLVADEVVRT